MKVKCMIEIELKDQTIQDILEECPIGYWGKFIDRARTTVKLNEPELHKGQAIFKVDMEKGFQLLAEKYPVRFGRFKAEDFDGEDEDVLVQLATLGEVVFG